MMTDEEHCARKLLVRKRCRALAHDESEGSALVELAVTLPVIFLIMTGIFAFSVALYQKLALAEGVSAGARTLAADRGMDTDPCKTTVNAVYAAAPTLSQSSFSFTFVINGVTKTGTSCSGTTLTQYTSGQIQATYPCSIRVDGFSFPSCSLSTAITEQIQ